MQWKHALIIGAALILVAIAILPRMQGPAFGHDADHGDSCTHYTIHFPETDDEKIARLYATTQIVTVHLQQKNQTLSTAQLSDLVRAVNNALD